MVNLGANGGYGVSGQGHLGFGKFWEAILRLAINAMLWATSGSCSCPDPNLLTKPMPEALAGGRTRKPPSQSLKLSTGKLGPAYISVDPLLPHLSDRRSETREGAAVGCKYYTKETIGVSSSSGDELCRLTYLDVTATHSNLQSRRLIHAERTLVEPLPSATSTQILGEST